MEDYPANSQKEQAKTKPDDKKIEQVVKGEVARRKKPLGKRFAETFVQGEAQGVWSFVVLDVLLPAAKDMVADAFSQGIERMLFGEVRSTSRRTGSRPGSTQYGGHTAYNRYSTSSSRRDEPRQISRRSRSTHDFDEIIIPTRVEAEEVIDRMFEIISRYEQVTVAELYELVGVTGNYTDDKWGWTDLRGANVSRIRNGYLLDLPRPEPLD